MQPDTCNTSVDRTRSFSRISDLITLVSINRTTSRTLIHLHFGLSVNLEVVQGLFGHSRRAFISKFDKGNVFLRRNSTDLDETGVSANQLAGAFKSRGHSLEESRRQPTLSKRAK